MEYRHYRKHFHSRFQSAASLDALERKCVEVQICKHYALRTSRSSAAVKDSRGIVGSAVMYGCRFAVSARDKALPVGDGALGRLFLVRQRIAHLYVDGHTVADAHLYRFQSLALLHHALYLVGYKVNGKYQLAVREFNKAYYLVLGGHRVYHVGDGSRHAYGIEKVYRLGSVRQAYGNGITAPDACRGERSGASADLGYEPAECHAFSEIVERTGVGIFFRSPLGKLVYRTFGIIKMSFHLSFQLS